MRLFQSEIRQSSYVEDLMSYRVLSYRKKNSLNLRSPTAIAVCYNAVMDYYTLKGV